MTNSAAHPMSLDGSGSGPTATNGVVEASTISSRPPRRVFLLQSPILQQFRPKISVIFWKIMNCSVGWKTDPSKVWDYDRLWCVFGLQRCQRCCSSQLPRGRSLTWVFKISSPETRSCFWIHSLRIPPLRGPLFGDCWNGWPRTLWHMMFRHLQ